MSVIAMVAVGVIAFVAIKHFKSAPAAPDPATVPPTYAPQSPVLTATPVVQTAPGFFAAFDSLGGAMAHDILDRAAAAHKAADKAKEAASLMTRVANTLAPPALPAPAAPAAEPPKS